MASIATSSKRESSGHLRPEIDVDLEARDSTTDRQAEDAPTPMSDGIFRDLSQSEAQFGEHRDARASKRAEEEEREEQEQAGRSRPSLRLRSPRPSFISIPPRFSFSGIGSASASQLQSAQSQSQDPQTNDSVTTTTTTTAPIQRRPSLISRAASHISNSVSNTIRVMSPPDDSTKLAGFHAAVSNYGTLTSIPNNSAEHLGPRDLRAPAPPDPSPITTLESVPPSRAGSEVGSQEGWFGKRERLSVRRGGKEPDRGSSTAVDGAVVVAEPEQIGDAGSSRDGNDRNIHDNDGRRNDDTNQDTVKVTNKSKGPSISFVKTGNFNERDVLAETIKWRDAVPPSQTLPSPHQHSTPPPSPGPFSKKAASFVAALERMKPSPAMVLENSGSVARDHLACERTYLAYVRTSLAIASTGVALVQLFTIAITRPDSTGGGADGSHIQKFARPLGATVVIMGLLVLLIGSTRYYRIQSALIHGNFPPARGLVTGLTAGLALLVSIVFGVLVAVPR